MHGRSLSCIIQNAHRIQENTFNITTYVAASSFVDLIKSLSVGVGEESATIAALFVFDIYFS